MNGWKVELTNSAKKELRRLDEGPKRDAAELIADLIEDPLAVPATELRHYPGLWRARFHHGLYRMIYRISKPEKRVVIRRIRPRATAYEGMMH